ncbi:MAG: imidazoleglycerol-phosphate dehydratase HisB [Verrucomicrobiota bacterium]|nr:imidazoleglycerol-phosphate dehydratase HisB [Verrucomicrobiota bacterium]
MKKRTAKIRRKTRETDVEAQLNVDGRGAYSVNTGLPFLDHMLELLAKHAKMDIRIQAKGDLRVDYHHTVEDIGLTLGMAFDQALGARRGIRRYGWSFVPMDEALSRVVVDFSGRPFLKREMACRRKKILDFDLALMEDFFRAFTIQARMNLHIAQFYGEEAHHAHESVFKALALAMRQACEQDPRGRSVPSSKGRI